MEWLGYIAAALTTVAFVPLAVKSIRTRDTRAISLAMYAMFVVGILSWFAYGVSLRSWPMIASNAVTSALAATIPGLKPRHG